MPRTKGTPNRVTSEARATLQIALEGQIEHIEAALNQIRSKDPRTYLLVLAKLLAFIMPKPQEQSITITGPTHPPSWFNQQTDANEAN